MENEPVAWLEGMFLRPHHMQTAERNLNDTISHQVELDHGYNYGLRRISFSAEAIANGQFELTECRARMRDGSVIWISAGEAPDRVGLGAMRPVPAKNLKEAFEQDDTLDIYLAVPKLRLGRSNLLSNQAGAHRFVSTTKKVADENDGGNDQEVQLRSLNVQLLLGTQDRAGYETLLIARVKRSGANESAPTLDHRYIPPVLACDAWPELDRDYVRAVYDILGQRMQQLGAQVASRGLMQGAMEADDVRKLMMLSTLNQGYASLRSLAFARGVHPLFAYTELCRIVGSLSIFRTDRQVGEIPLYDHDDLERIFRWVREEIRMLVATQQQDVYEQEDFVGVDRHLEAVLRTNWLGNNWEWYLGVHYEQFSTRQCRTLFERGTLEWKLGSHDRVEWMYKNKVKGLESELVETPAPRALPQGGNWIYYNVRRGGPVWDYLFANETKEPRLGLKINERVVDNIDSLHGQKELQLRTDDLRGTLNFRLFAVPLSGK